MCDAHSFLPLVSGGAIAALSSSLFATNLNCEYVPFSSSLSALRSRLCAFSRPLLFHAACLVCPPLVHLLFYAACLFATLASNRFLLSGKTLSGSQRARWRCSGRRTAAGVACTRLRRPLTWPMRASAATRPGLGCLLAPFFACDRSPFSLIAILDYSILCLGSFFLLFQLFGSGATAEFQFISFANGLTMRHVFNCSNGGAVSVTGESTLSLRDALLSGHAALFNGGASLSLSVESGLPS